MATREPSSSGKRNGRCVPQGRGDFLILPDAEAPAAVPTDGLPSSPKSSRPVPTSCEARVATQPGPRVGRVWPRGRGTSQTLAAALFLCLLASALGAGVGFVLAACCGRRELALGLAAVGSGLWLLVAISHRLVSGGVRAGEEVLFPKQQVYSTTESLDCLPPISTESGEEPGARSLEPGAGFVELDQGMLNPQERAAVGKAVPSAECDPLVCVWCEVHALEIQGRLDSLRCCTHPRFLLNRFEAERMGLPGVPCIHSTLTRCSKWEAGPVGGAKGGQA